MTKIASVFLLVILLSALMQYQCVYSSDVSAWCTNDVEEPYQSVLDFINTQTIGENELQNIIDSLLTRAGCYWLQNEPVNDMNCSDCLKASDIYQHYFKIPTSAILSPEQFFNVSIILTTYVYQLRTVCSRGNQLDWTTVTNSYFIDQLMHIPDVFSDHVPHHGDVEMFTVGQLETLLRNVSNSYIPGQKLETFTSVRPDDIISTCIFDNLRSVNSYLLMDAATANHSEAIEKEQLDLLSSYIFSQLLHGTCITTSNPEVPDSDAFLQSIYETFGAGHGCVFNETGVTEIMSKLGLNPPEHDHDHGATEQSASDVTISLNATSSQHHEIDVKTTCLNIDDIFTSFSIENIDQISRTEFYKLCPALLQQVVIGCTSEASTSDSPKPSAAEAYGYGTLAVFIICLLSLVGLIIVKFKDYKVYHYILVAMLGLGVGSLVGDALLHLVPEALGLHDHEHSSHSTDVVVEDYTWKMLACCGSVWMFYVLQLTLLWIGRFIKSRSSKTHPRDNASGKINHAAIIENSNNSTTLSVIEEPSAHGNDVNLPSADDNSETSSRRSSDASLSHTHVHPTVAWMVTVGDGLHNLTDGLAIGASFGLGWNSGLATTIAVACHELPHEFGDVAILLSAGWSPLKVFIFQLVSASTAFIGLYVGLAVSENSETAQQWIFAIAAGLFLYVALTDVMPELVEYFQRGNALWMFLLSNAGIFLGFLSMCLLAIFEEQIVIK